MELIYLKNISNKNLKNLDIYFSNEYQFNGTAKKVKKTTPNLFNKNLKLNVIVGENGSGKSAILEHIYDFSQMYYFFGDKETELTHGGSDFLIYKKDEVYIKGDRYGIFEDQLESEYNDQIIELPQDEYSNVELRSNDDSINCSFLNFSDDESNIFTLLKVLLKKYDVFKYFNKKLIFKKIKFKFNRDNIIYLNENEHSFPTLFKQFKDRVIILINENVKDIPSQKAFQQLNKATMFTTHNIELELKIIYLIKYINDLQKRFINQTSDNQDFLAKNEDFFNNMTFENMFELIIQFNTKINEADIFHSNTEKEIAGIKELIKILVKEESEKIRMQSHYIFDKNTIIDFETSVTLNIEEDHISIKAILGILEESLMYSSFFESIDYDILSYKEDVSFNKLSSGEKSLITKYMYIVHEIIFNRAEVILLDEPDTFLHPNWSKSFINDLVNIIEQDSLLKNNNIHIIITTHSPFMISDLPKENLIFLKDGKQVYPFTKEQTFGANIHNLLSDGFFMEGGLMGEFAKSKINEVVGLLKKSKLDEGELEYCRYIISIIGEPILQKTLKYQLNKIIYGNETELQELEREQKELETRIHELKRNS